MWTETSQCGVKFQKYFHLIMVNCNSSILCTRPADGAPKYYLQFFRPPIQCTVKNFGGQVDIIQNNDFLVSHWRLGLLVGSWAHYGNWIRLNPKYWVLYQCPERTKSYISLSISISSSIILSWCWNNFCLSILMH